MNFFVQLRSPSAVIYKSHEEKVPAPFAATFSSRGPNPGSKNVLKVLICTTSNSIISKKLPKFIDFGYKKMSTNLSTINDIIPKIPLY
jgi:hypothetical protein